ncbi:MAG: sel1 repeat family protein [Pseudomonadales bacterium]|nr:sel1 repeat family protein [Pseudomonadales bacterium]
MSKSTGENENMQLLQKGVNAFMHFEFDQAFQILLPLAEQGVLEAQQKVARMYFAGNGVEKSHDQYLYWLQQAADQGDKYAKAKLKRMAKKKLP